ncbi:TetR/AcrR family transcriptional regulator [Pseudomonas sp. ADAK2]|uniref:TetR/AcrR family transcriptional regulator n=1 Tax=unclassified Pseudomonas TaxID=196821 RepID=UPI0014644E4A|nr:MULTISPECIES: TetR/AcrR family transcriptional regulator [unclassified Pseudomonas]QJI40140.1 TetR/AcrR family transcriptional regulator [Pseudomonas sp. ADAK7]QJI46445.1 TetR/AcrR family transcriptional regulator [Pseudomonas sp. ADAK2]
MPTETARAESLFERTASPREKKRVQRIEDIIEVAASIFVSDGYAQFSARKVASELGISLSNLQHYCGTTENLLASMIRAKIESFVTLFHDIASNTAMPPQERFMAILDGDMAATLDPWIASFSFQVWALAEHDEVVNALLKRIYGDFCQTLSELIVEVNPSISLEKARVHAILIASQIEGVMFYNKQIGAESVSWDALLKTMKTLWLKTILEG